MDCRWRSCATAEVGHQPARAPSPSALAAAEIRLLPVLATRLSLPQIAEEMFLSRHTSKSQAYSLTASWAPPRGAKRSPVPANWGSWRADPFPFIPSGGWNSPRREVDWCSAAS
jgi:DNA-binding CsgD family transcriptional regulator